MPPPTQRASLGALQPEQPEARKSRRGRPPKEPPWLAWAAELYAQGYTLRKALRKLGVVLSWPERRNIYRLKRFRELVEAYRREHGDYRDDEGR
jgi:hypothetical protein